MFDWICLYLCFWMLFVVVVFVVFNVGCMFLFVLLGVVVLVIVVLGVVVLLLGVYVFELLFGWMDKLGWILQYFMIVAVNLFVM